jgi:hypothetical protein
MIGLHVEYKNLYANVYVRIYMILIVFGNKIHVGSEFTLEITP